MITIGALAGLRDALRAEFAVFFTERTFQLRTGEDVTCRCCITTGANDGVLRRINTEGLTGGMDQERRNISIFADEWDAVSPDRPPKKGDICLNGSERLAVEKAFYQEAAGLGFLWKLEVEG